MTVDATVLDLSTTGMGLATAVAAPKPSVGDACAIEFTVDGVRIEGREWWCGAVARDPIEATRPT